MDAWRVDELANARVTGGDRLLSSDAAATWVRVASEYGLT